MDKIDYRELLICEYEHWDLYLNEYQCYVGRVCLSAKRDDVIDFLEMTSEEEDEFFKVSRSIKRALTKLFKPDLMNYASLGNKFIHLHVHIVPRYAEKREFEGIEFVDKRWGKNYAPYDREFRLPLEKLKIISDAIRKELDGDNK